MVSDVATIEIRELRCFVAVGRRLGITAAARSLDLPKSAVSKTLSALEARLGLRLFERSSRRVALTREGESLLARAEAILADLENLMTEARHEFVEPAGTVRIAASPEFGALLVSRFIPGLLRRHPRLQVAMQLEYAHADLLDPRVDLAFRIGGVHDDRLVAKPLGSFGRILVAGPTWAAEHPVSEPRELDSLDALVFSDHDLAADWTMQPADASSPDKPIDVRVKARLAVRSFSALLAAAAADLGVARVPAFAAAEALARGTVVRVLPHWVSSPARVQLVHRFGMERIGRVRAVLEAAQTDVVALLSELGP
ncbi:HTH-type transcriptional regulator DmlR [Burkholderiaceae bacterium]|nr:HTH-type transcriptional regulator DmlR [Burkholderiaceae bacterium]